MPIAGRIPDGKGPCGTPSVVWPTVTLTGRLTTKPKPGRPDRSGNRTAYARFAAHAEGEQAHDYIATFHRQTAQLALSLARGAQVTVEGYPHASGSEKRMDTLSVFRIIDGARGGRWLEVTCRD